MYITIDEFENGLSLSLRTLLSSDDGISQDDDVITEAIKQASSLIDSYASYRYVIPLTNVTDQIKAVCIDITVYRLFKRKEAVTNDILESYNAGINYLKDISQDRALIEGADLKTNINNNTVQLNVYAKAISDKPKFDEDNLKGLNIN